MHATENVVSMSFQFSKDSKLTIEIQFIHGEGSLAKFGSFSDWKKKTFWNFNFWHWTTVFVLNKSTYFPQKT